MRRVILLLGLLTIPWLARADQPCTPLPTTETTVALVWPTGFVTPPRADWTFTSYVLKRRVNTGPWTQLTMPPPGSRNAMDGPVTPGNRYDYALFSQFRKPTGEVVTSLQDAPYIDPPPCYLVHRPPVIQITGPTSQPTYATESTPLTFGGTASDDNGVQKVTWSCSTCTPTSGIANGTTNWTAANVGLKDGLNVVTATVVDLHGAALSTVLTVTLASQAPAPAGLSGVRD